MSINKCDCCKDVMFGNENTCGDCDKIVCDGCINVSGQPLICDTCINQREENLIENLNKNINER